MPITTMPSTIATMMTRNTIVGWRRTARTAASRPARSSARRSRCSGSHLSRTSVRSRSGNCSRHRASPSATAGSPDTTNNHGHYLAFCDLAAVRALAQGCWAATDTTLFHATGPTPEPADAG